jgi:3-oxoacyl-[acyl-carrier-protein] synthase II
MVEYETNISIAVTGMAWTTALGNDLNTVWERLCAGESGIREEPSSYNLRNNRVASVEHKTQNLSPSEHIHTMTMSTIERALQDAKIEHRSKNIILIVGTSFGARLDDELEDQSTLHQWVETISKNLGLTSISLSTACSSASDAILMGSALIKSGWADICICGGADILGDSKRLAHSALGTMSRTTLRSFDENRDGTILGEGAGFIVLEKYSKDINKKIYAFLRGCGSANDAAGLTAPDQQGNGIRLAITRSLNDANIKSSNITLINAHGSGTLTNDSVEAKAYKDIFKNVTPTVFATKGAFGHSLGATGSIEAIALILALSTQTVPPIKDLFNPLEKNYFHLPMSSFSSHQSQFGLSLTIGFGGFNTSLIFEKAA